MAASTYKPLQTSNQPGGSSIIDQNFNAIKSALDQLATLFSTSAFLSLQTSNYSIQGTDRIIFMNPTAGATITAALPDATKVQGVSFLIKNISPSGTVTVAVRPNQKLEGASTPITLTSLQVIGVTSDGSSFWKS